MGFIYWSMKIESSNYIFIGGRGNNKEFFNDIGERTGVKIKVVSTSSAKKGETSLIEKLKTKEPVMIFGDMGFLPWFELPKDYHFGGHTFVICGYDGKETALASDIDQKATGVKKGFYYPITLEQLSIARSSNYKPFPPKNTYLEFDFKNFHTPETQDIVTAIEQTIQSQLNPPIKNLGVKGLRHTAREIIKWQKIFNDNELRMNLFNLYIFIEIGGTGGGCFRYLYSRFLNEAMETTGNKTLGGASKMFYESGKRFSEIGMMFKDAVTMDNISEKVEVASRLFNAIADIEEKAYIYLKENI
jgi:hypothetical protein